MRLIRIDRLSAGRAWVLAALAFAGGCTGPERVAAPTPTPQTVARSASAPVPASAPEPVPATAPSPPEAPVPAPPPNLPADVVAKSDTAVAKPPAKQAAASPPASAKAAAPATKAAPSVTAPQQAPAVAAPAATPSLDLKSLETRLRETKAIGVMTKLALKNQVDDLLDQFRMYYQGKLKTTLAELRRAYDGLVLKILALLQDADPPLAKDIALSREAIWGILADPVKFGTV